jgi:hypothetical protein
VSQYYSSDMTSFSAMTASLSPSADRPIRWHNRCLRCRSLAQGRDPGVCPNCQAAMEPIPYF